MTRTSRYRLYNVAAHTFIRPSLPPPPSEEGSASQDPSPSRVADNSISTADSDVDRPADVRSAD